METKTVKVRLDGDTYEDVECRELTAGQDWDALEQNKKRIPDQANPGQYIDEYDEKALIAQRYEAMTNGKVPKDKVWELPRKDRIVLGLAWRDLNEVSQEEKSSLVGSDSGRPSPAQGSDETAGDSD